MRQSKPAASTLPMPHAPTDRQRRELIEFLGEKGMRSPGWQIAEAALSQQIISRTALLIGCDTSGGPSAIVRLQTEIRLLQSLLQEPERFLLPTAGKQSNNG